MFKILQVPPQHPFETWRVLMAFSVLPTASPAALGRICNHQESLWATFGSVSWVGRKSGFSEPPPGSVGVSLK